MNRLISKVFGKVMYGCGMILGVVILISEFLLITIASWFHEDNWIHKHAMKIVVSVDSWVYRKCGKSFISIVCDIAGDED